MTRRNDVVDLTGLCLHRLHRVHVRNLHCLRAVGCDSVARRQHSKPLSQHSLRLCRTDRRQVIPPILAQ